MENAATPPATTARDAPAAAPLLEPLLRADARTQCEARAVRGNAPPARPPRGSAARTNVLTGLRRLPRALSLCAGVGALLSLGARQVRVVDRPVRGPQGAPRTPPNFVLVLADDLDLTLGGLAASTLARTRRLVGGEGDGGRGRTFADWFAQTPVCCASRAELLTGRTYHSLRVREEHDGGCMHMDVADDPAHPFWATHFFSNHFAAPPLDYRVGVFGKLLNSHNPTFVPNGVDEMLINNGGTYLDPTFSRGRSGQDVETVKFDNCTATTGMPCYSTAVIGNASLAWIRRRAADPFFALVSVKAPHIGHHLEHHTDDGAAEGDHHQPHHHHQHGVHPGFPMATPAPWYKDTPLPEQRAPRTPNYNVSGDQHWLLRTQPPLTQCQGQRVDELYASRLRTLMSVDDLVADLVRELEALGVLDNTYVLFTSDNGFRLGQHRMPMDKLHPYENDVRVPMLVRGPGIGDGGTAGPPGGGRPGPGAVFSHVHLLPTLLGLATGSPHGQGALPAAVDGTNLAGWLLDVPAPDGNATLGAGARSLLIEYNSQGNVVRYEHLIDTYNHSFVALRIMPDVPAAPGAAAVGGTPPAGATIEDLANLKYIEFRDSREDWTQARTPALERELYDLDRDPYELDNLLSGGRGATAVAPALLRALERKARRLALCAGEGCRREHATGLDWDGEETGLELRGAVGVSER